MNKLIVAALERNEATALAKFPQRLMYDYELEMVGWILRYQQKFNSLPTVNRLTRKFANFAPVYPEAGDPMDDIIVEEIDYRRRQIAASLIAVIDEKLQRDEPIPINDIHELATTMSLTQGGIQEYSEFDRDDYFRSNEQGISWGFGLFDLATGGIRDGEYALLAGRLGVGKTTLLKFMVSNWYAQAHRIMYVSNESSVNDVFLGLDAIIGHFNPLSLRQRGTDLDAIRSQMRTVSSIVKSCEGKIYVPTTRLSTPASVASMAKFLNVDVIVIDGVYLMQADRMIASKWERVSEVSNALKQMALDLNIKVIGVTQIKRVGEKEKYDSEDLAFSDSLGQDSDFVVSILPSEDNKNTFNAEFIKNRYGPRVAASYSVDFATMTMIENAIDDEPEDWSKGADNTL
jgi:replicative DNA helicase